MGFSRRQFLKLIPPSLFLGGCSSFDSVFTTQKKILDQEVLIVGGGAAGLAAAYQFKRANQPFKLFEASSRLGGRVYSAQSSSVGLCDLGAEFFTSRHETLLSFLKDLGFKPLIWKPQTEFFLFQGQEKNLTSFRASAARFVRSVLEYQRELYQGQSVVLNYQNQERLSKARYFDEMSARELLSKLGAKSSFEISSAFERQFEFKYGVSSQDLSALQFLIETQFEGATQYILPETLGFFIETLGQRVSGALPDYFVRPQMELVEISEIPLGLEMKFRTPKGFENYFARNVIFALPPQQLLKVKGFKDLELPSECLSHLEELRHHKLVKGIRSSDQTTTDVTFGDDFVRWSRKSATSQGFQVYQNNSGALSLLNVSGPIPQWDLYRNWSRVDHSSPGSHYWRPGFYRKQRGYWEQEFLNGKISFVGDYTSMRFPQSLEGALESGALAARRILDRLQS